MITGFFRANKENILYTILTIFLLERVRRGWNRTAAQGRAANMTPDAVERKQHWFMFGAATLYAVPFVLPVVRYLYRSFTELSQYVSGLEALSSIWALAVVVLLVEAFLAVVLYNLLGIYVERMNGAVGFFRKIGRSVVDGSRIAVVAGVAVPRRVTEGIRDAATESVRTGRTVAAVSGLVMRRSLARVAHCGRRVAASGTRFAGGLARRAARPLARRLVRYPSI